MTDIIDTFVYGTLRTGQALHELLRPHITRKSEATARGNLFRITNQYPAVHVPVDNEECGTVHGEIFTVPLNEEVMKVVNMEIASGYRPKWVTSTFPNGKVTNALMFTWEEEPNPDLIIASGDWVQELDDELVQAAIELGDYVCANEDLMTDIISILCQENSINNVDNSIEQAELDLDVILYAPEHLDTLTNYVDKAQKLNDSTN